MKVITLRDQAYRIALLFNANKVYDRNVICGIGEYIHATNIQWDIYIEDDFVTSIDLVENLSCDGVIADFDDIELTKLLEKKDIPVVGVGSSYQDETKYPDSPYVATDNHSLIDNAFKHLKDKGISNFAFYGLPDVGEKQWALERESIFKQIVSNSGYQYSMYRGERTSSKTWKYSMNRLSDWLQKLPKGTGIIAVTDSRARHLLQACDNLGIIVPDHLSIVGIDNEHMARHLTRISLSSVDQPCRKMGFEAGKMMHALIEGRALRRERVVIKSSMVHERQSSEFKAINDPYVIKAMHYIRTHIKDGIKVYHVLDELRLSRSNLEAKFKQEVGYTIHHEIHETRLKLACSILTNTELPINEIYSMCGYPSLQYMYSVFSKSIGTTPKGYREKSEHEAL